jgi:hypothetical protein
MPQKLGFSTSKIMIKCHFHPAAQREISAKPQGLVVAYTGYTTGRARIAPWPPIARLGSPTAGQKTANPATAERSAVEKPQARIAQVSITRQQNFPFKPLEERSKEKRSPKRPIPRSGPVTERARLAFEIFAKLHPHEAARLNWKEFVRQAKRTNPEATEALIRRALKETEGTRKEQSSDPRASSREGLRLHRKDQTTGEPKWTDKSGSIAT